jgi:allophanate hydrolase subunit 2
MGGYVKIACLIAADMDRMAQLRLREFMRFKRVTVEEARSILEETLGKIKEENIIRR